MTGALGPFALALTAGILSFTSPCCLPLMPGYVSYVSGVAAGTDGSVAVRTRVLTSALLFVSGFALVFTTLGASASALGSVLLHHRTGLIQIAGVVVIAMGLITMGLLRIPLLYREFRWDLNRFAPGPAGALPLGMAFAMGWTPCIGPVLGGILVAASSTQDPLRGAALLFTYSLGLGIPFVLLALGYSRGGRLFGWLRRHGRALELVGGGVLVLMGILMITGGWLQLFAPVLRWFARTGWPPL